MFVGFGLLTLSTCALTGLPLLNLPGYELGAAVALAHGLTGGLFALAAMHLDRAASPVRTGLAVTIVLWLSAALTFFVATLVGWLTTPCDPFATAAFFPVLALPSALVSASVGALLGTCTRRRWTGLLAWLGVLLLSAAVTSWPLLLGPQVFAYDHLGGYLPGPLYDEALRLPASLLWFRLASLCLALASLALAARRTWPFAAALLGFLTLETNGTRLGFRINDAALIAALGGTRADAQLTLHYSSGLSKAAVDRVFEDVRFRHAQVAAFLGASSAGRVTIWWYESPAQKQRLVGAAQTQFSKPWRREVHVNASGFPHPVIKHELVHAMAAAWGAPPFGVTARLGFPHAGIIEGLAVAADNPVDDLTLHEWAAAMKKRGLLPDVRTLLGTGGFYAAPASRAYTTAGSFLRYLVETSGTEPLRRLYRDADFEAAYGRSLDSLATQFEAFLERVPLDAAATNQAFARFKGGSLFERPCAREVALLAQQAAAEPGERALATWRRCRALQPNEPAHALTAGRVLRGLGREDEAAAVLDELLVKVDGDAAAWADAALERLALAMNREERPLARALLERIIARQVAPAVDRTARVRLAGLDDPAVQRFFAGTDEAATLYFLRGAFEQGGSWVVRYLLGRKLHQVGEETEALPLLEATALDDAVPTIVAKEATRLALEGTLALNDCARLARLAVAGRFGRAFEARAADALERCRFSMVAQPRDR